MIIDGVDEAATPESLCRDVLRHLARHSQGRIRLLLGTRPYLLEQLDVERPAAVDLDSDAFADRVSLREYTARVLVKSNPKSPYRPAGRSTATGSESQAAARPDTKGVAAAVAEAAGTSFLVARIVASTLAAADHAVPDPADPAWRRTLPRHADQAMADDLSRRLGPDARRAVDLLRPLAYAQGEGLPWENLWTAMAGAMSGRDYTDDDVLWLRERAGSYFVETVESGRSAYRLYHQALADHLTSGIDEKAAHSTYVDVLIDAIPLQSDGLQDWSRAHPYTLQHLAWHAVQAGRLDEVLEEAEYLVHGAPEGIVPQLQHAAGASAQLIATVYRSNLGMHAQLDSRGRRRILAMAAATGLTDQLHQRLTERTPRGEWAARWASGPSVLLNAALRQVLAEPWQMTMDVACTSIDGVPIAVTADLTHLKLWNLRTGTLHGGPIDSDFANQVECTTVRGDPVAVTGGSRGIQAWDLRSRQRLACTFEDGFVAVRALACDPARSMPVAAALGSDGALRTWDLDTGKLLHPPVHLGGEPFLTTIACIPIDDDPAVVVVRDKTAAVWRVRDGRAIHADYPFGPAHGAALACGFMNGTPIMIIRSDKRFQVWDLQSRQLCREIEGDTHPRHIRIAETDIGSLLISVGVLGAITVWDVASGTRLGAPLEIGFMLIHRVATTIIDGLPVAITVEPDGQRATCVWNLTPLGLRDDQPHHARLFTMNSAFIEADGSTYAVVEVHEHYQVWDIETGSISRSPRIENLAGIACGKTGETPVILASDRATVRTRNLLSHQMLGEPVATEHTQRPESLALTMADEGCFAVATYYDGSLRAYRPHPGGEHILSAELVHHTVVACTLVDGDPVAITAGWKYRPQKWNLRTGELLTTLTDKGTDRAHHIACTTIGDTPVAVMTGARNVLIWDLRSNEIQRLSPHGLDPVMRSIQCSQVRGLPTATITYDDHVEIWDLAARELVDSVSLPNPVTATMTSRGDLAVIFRYGLAVFRRR